MTQLLQADNLVKHFQTRGGLVRAVDGVSLTLNRGETLALVGESGCGKSTLGRLLIHLLEADSGRVLFEGKNIARHEMKSFRRRAQIVFQDPFRSLNPRRSVGDAIMEPLLVHGLARGKEAQARVIQLLQEVGLDANASHRFPHEFSGGQRQRIGIARALAVEPDLLVLDEPVAALDVSVQAQIVRLLMDLQERRGLGYIFISHNLGVVRHIAHRVAVMYCGVIVETAPVAELYAAPRHPYTRALLQSVPEPDPTRLLRATLGGDAPDAMNIAPGCRFHPRCPLAREIAEAQASEMQNTVTQSATTKNTAAQTTMEQDATTQIVSSQSTTVQAKTSQSAASLAAVERIAASQNAASHAKTASQDGHEEARAALSDSPHMSTRDESNFSKEKSIAAVRIPRVCACDEPALREVQTDHFSACHFAGQLAAQELQ